MGLSIIQLAITGDIGDWAHISFYRGKSASVLPITHVLIVRNIYNIFNMFKPTLFCFCIVDSLQFTIVEKVTLIHYLVLNLRTTVITRRIFGFKLGLLFEFVITFFKQAHCYLSFLLPLHA